VLINDSVRVPGGVAVMANDTKPDLLPPFPTCYFASLLQHCVFHRFAALSQRMLCSVYAINGRTILLMTCINETLY
jgi:hypothetical protein